MLRKWDDLNDNSNGALRIKMLKLVIIVYFLIGLIYSVCKFNSIKHIGSYSVEIGCGKGTRLWIIMIGYYTNCVNSNGAIPGALGPQQSKYLLVH